MENATKRIRKARRQGLAAVGRGLAARSTRAPLRSRTRGKGLPGTPRATERRRSLVTTRKAERQVRQTRRTPRPAR